MRFEVLGPITADRDGERIPLAGPMVRSLLGVLLLDAGLPVPESRLTDALWGGSPPVSAKASLQNHVLRLRRVLGPPDSERVRRSLDGYLIEVGRGELDLQDFGELRRRGSEHLEAGRWQAAADTLSRALALWRGDPLADALPATRDLIRLGHLPEARLKAIEQLAQAQLRLGRYDQVVADLGPTVRLHPWRETMHGDLMHALYGAGRQVDALAAYQALRTRLVDDLGIEPSTAVSDIHQRILAADPDLLVHDSASGRASPVADPPIGSVGSVTTDDAARPDSLDPDDIPGDDLLRAEFLPRLQDLRVRIQELWTDVSPHLPRFDWVPPLLSEPAHPRPPHEPDHHLPARPPLLTGRDKELAELTRLAFGPDTAMRSGVTILSGTAGVGKTALALTWAHDTAKRYPDGRLYLDLNGFAAEGRPLGTDTAVRILLDFLGISPDHLPATPEGRIALYRTVVVGKRLLLILDNARDAHQVRPLIPVSDACRVVVTSRHTLESLVVHDGADAVGLTPLAAEDARDLLVHRLGTARAAGQEATIAIVAERCARLPLALTIASARAAALADVPLDHIAEQLAAEPGGLALLDGGDPTTSVRNVISWSYQWLAPGPARLFRLLGLHPGPDITVSAAAALAGVGRPTTASDLVELRVMSLVAEVALGRYSMHGLLRAFARERVQAEESDAERSAAHRRLMDFYATSSLEANRHIADYPEFWDPFWPAPDPQVDPETFRGVDRATAWFIAESDVLRNVIAAADAAGSDADVWRLGYAQIVHFNRRGRWRDALELGSLALAAASRQNETAAQAHLHRHIGTYLAKLGDIPGGRDHLLQSLRLYRADSNAVGEAHTHQSLSGVCDLEEDWAGAIDHMRRYLDYTRAVGHRTGEAMALNAIGWFVAHMNDPADGLSACHQAVTIISTTGRRDLEAHVWDSLGFIHHRLGDHDQAAANYRTAAELSAEAAYGFQEARERLRLGDVYADRGDMDSAQEAWTRALVLFEEAGGPEAEQARGRLSVHAE
jgi:DNA-binding SARP family transcriptional activator/tetratricopeptide (TPR) repeat protein